MENIKHKKHQSLVAADMKDLGILELTDSMGIDYLESLKCSQSNKNSTPYLYSYTNFTKKSATITFTSDYTIIEQWDEKTFERGDGIRESEQKKSIDLDEKLIGSKNLSPKTDCFYPTPSPTPTSLLNKSRKQFFNGSGLDKVTSENCQNEKNCRSNQSQTELEKSNHINLEKTVTWLTLDHSISSEESANKIDNKQKTDSYENLHTEINPEMRIVTEEDDTIKTDEKNFENDNCDETDSISDKTHDGLISLQNEEHNDLSNLRYQENIDVLDDDH